MAKHVSWVDENFETCYGQGTIFMPLLCFDVLKEFFLKTYSKKELFLVQCHMCHQSVETLASVFHV
jgi:hypothetical protein